MPELQTEVTDRRTRKKQRTRREIYDAAMVLFAKHGYEPVTIDMICNAADVGRSTFFLHFPAKAALVSEFSRRLAEDFAAELEDNPPSSAVEALVGLIRKMGQRFQAHQSYMLAMFREFIMTPAAIVHSRVEERALPDLFEKIIERGQRSGEFSNRIHPRLATEAILSTAGAILYGWVFGDAPIDPSEIEAQYLEMIFHGLRTDIPSTLRAKRANK